jgi:hypothetical protein
MEDPTPDENGTEFAGCINVLAEDGSASSSEKCRLTR